MIGRVRYNLGVLAFERGDHHESKRQMRKSQAAFIQMLPASRTWCTTPRLVSEWSAFCKTTPITIPAVRYGDFDERRVFVAEFKDVLVEGQDAVLHDQCRVFLPVCQLLDCVWCTVGAAMCMRTVC